MNLLVRSVRWDITNKCNLKCIHCYTQDHPEEDLELSEIIKIIKKLKVLGLQEVNLAGREPTLRTDLIDIIEWCYKHGLDINITTNGTAIGFNDYKTLINSGLNMIVFSLDSASEQTHDRIRGKGTFAKTVKNIIKCVDYTKNNHIRTKIGISCTLHKMNIDELPGIIRLCHYYDVDFLGINPMSFCGAALENKRLLYLPPEHILSCWNKICLEYKTLQPKYELYLGTFPMEAKLLNAKFNLDLPVIQTGCSAGKTVYIDHQGRALPCYMIPVMAEHIPGLRPYLKYWYVLKQPTSAAYELFKPFITFARKHTQNNNQGCIGCADIDVCRRCPLIAISDPDAIYRCQLARKRLESIKINPDKKVIPKIKNYVDWNLQNDVLSISLKNGDYYSTKEFRLDSLAQTIWSSVHNNYSIEQIQNRLCQDRPQTSVAAIQQNISEFMDYFWKEGLIELQY